MNDDPNWQESETLEFKSSLCALSSERGSERDGIATICAFANHNGGTLCVGVRDDGSPIGLDISEKTLREVANNISNLTMPPIIAEVRHEKMEGRSVLDIVVGRSDERPHRYRDKPYIRCGSSTKVMPDYLYKQMIRERPAVVDFCARPVPGTSISDVLPEALTKFRHLLSLRTCKEQQMVDEQLLHDFAILARSEELTFGGLLLLGNSRALQRYAGQAEIRYLYFRTPFETQYAYQNRETSLQPLVLQLDNILDLIDVRSNITNVQYGLFRLEVKDFDRDALQEAILNAIIHRDYGISGHIFIRHYPDRIEISSPGGFLEDITPANILVHPPRFRNPSMALLLSRVFAVQQAGQGVDLIVNASAKRGAIPSYDASLPNDVILTIPSGVPEQSLFAFIAKVEEQTQQYLSVLESLVALTIKEQRGATKQIIKDELTKWNVPEKLTEKTISSLIERNVLEFFGDRKARRYYLARHIYHLLGEAGELTRGLGPSPKGIEAAILDHLELHGEGTIQDFITALSLSPHDKRQRDRIGKVLKSLRRKEVIVMVKLKGKVHYRPISKSA